MAVTPAVSVDDYRSSTEFTMTAYKIVHLPPHVISPTESIAAPFDSCFIPCGFLFPETRDGLEPYREFPLSEPFYSIPKRNDLRDGSVDDLLAEPRSEDTESGFFDSTILQITEIDELLLDVQGMGMQYTMHTQMCLRSDLSYHFPRTWDKNQALLVNIPVFSEERCQWHYPISTMGYNIANTDPPLDIDIAHNYPQLFGYLPNGDLVLYWEIAEVLAEEFGLEIDPLRTTVDGTLVIMPNCPDNIKQAAPCDQITETGIAVDLNRDPTQAISYAQHWLGRPPMVLRYSMYHFYRLRLPVIHCELDFNSYGEATWGAFGFTSPRLAGFEFKINNNPFSRESHMFSTERGNVVISVALFQRLQQLLNDYGAPLCSQIFPIQRIP